MWDDVRLPAEAMEPEFMQLFDYWCRKAPEGALPGRQHIDPTELPGRLLPHLLLMDVERPIAGPAMAGDPVAGEQRSGQVPTGLRFRFRVASTSLSNLIGRDVTGQCFDEIGPPDRVEPVCSALTTIAATGRPVFLAGGLTLPSEDFCRVKRLGLPLARDGQLVDMIIAIFLLERRPLIADPATEPTTGPTDLQQFVVL